MAESSSEASATSPSGWHGPNSPEAPHWLSGQPANDYGDYSNVPPHVLHGKLLKLNKKIRIRKKLALFIKREVEELRSSSGATAFSYDRLMFYEAELACRKAALLEAVEAREFLQWYLANCHEATSGVYNQEPVKE